MNYDDGWPTLVGRQLEERFDGEVLPFNLTLIYRAVNPISLQEEQLTVEFGCRVNPMEVPGAWEYFAMRGYEIAVEKSMNHCPPKVLWRRIGA